MGTVLVDEHAEVRIRGFALVFDRLAKASTFVFNANSSDFISEVFCSLSSSSLCLKSVTNLFNPWEIQTNEWELSLFFFSKNFHSIIYFAGSWVVSSITGPILVFPRMQPFGADDFSSFGKVYSRQATASVNCENYAVCFVRNPASVQILITRFCCESLSTRFWYFCTKSSCARISAEGLGVIINKFVGANNGSDCSTRVSPYLFDRYCIPQTNLRLLSGYWAD